MEKATAAFKRINAIDPGNYPNVYVSKVAAAQAIFDAANKDLRVKEERWDKTAEETEFELLHYEKVAAMAE